MSFNYVSRVVGVDPATGYTVAVDNDGNAGFVTDCCGASAKGCDGYTGCRACYAEIDPGLGGLPDPIWYAPQHRARIAGFNDWLLDMIVKGSQR
jgi:hypothetical protein